MNQFQQRFLLQRRGGGARLKQANDWFREHGYQSLYYALLHGEYILGHQDVDGNHSNEDEGESTQHVEDVFPGRGPLLDGNILADGIYSRMANIFSAKNFQPS
jgi:hypothetical protein